MATFSVRFLGCKVSQTDAQEIRERLVAEGHVQTDGEAEEGVLGIAA
jgi:tRNA A37 methylthiotransferase MiaB